MPVIVQLRRGALALEGNGTLMAICRRAEIPVGSSCSGQGSCGRCLVVVLEGQEALSAPDEHELRVLARIGAQPNQRLSCQCRLVQPATVRITTSYW